MSVKVYRDGRTVLSGPDYTAHKRKKYEAQGQCCADCKFGFPFNRLEFHHYAGRGNGGCFRDDLDPRNRMLCKGLLGCHEKATFEKQRNMMVGVPASDRERDLAAKT